MRIAGFRSRGLADADSDPDAEPQPITACLFDFSNTLFHAVDMSEWLRGAAASQGRTFDEAEVGRLAAELEEAWSLPDVAAAQEGRDLSPDAHRAAGLTWLRAVEGLADLAEPAYDLLTSPECWVPYDDTAPVLAELRKHGVPVGIVSDIAWDIRSTFAHHRLEGLVDGFALSYEHGVGKPDPKLFRAACEQIGAEPRRTLMVGDNAASDGGANAIGIRSFILPVHGALARRRGLDTVLRIVDA